MAAAATSTLSFSQVQLTTAHSPVINDTFIVIGDTLANAGVDKGNAGTSETYIVADYDQDSKDTTFFLDPSTQSRAVDFPTANLALDLGLGIGFLESSATGIQLLGLSIQNPFDSTESSLILDDPETNAVYPSAYGDSYTDEAYGQTSFFVGQDLGGFQIDSVRITYESEIDAMYDGLGTINNGVNTYNTLRERKQEIIKITIEGCIKALPFLPCSYQDVTAELGFSSEPDTTVTYSYYTEAITTKAPVVALTYNANETDLQQVSVNGQEELLTGISEKLRLPSVNVYPNPAISEITIETESPVVAGQIINTTGKVLMNITSNQVNISSLATGMYLIIGTTSNGSLFQASVQKF